MKLKKAFSITELVLVMGIIGVVTAIGVSITKPNMEKAYNLFWYTGYSNLCNATNDAIDKLEFLPSDPDLSKYAAHVCNLMNVQASCRPDGSCACTASNGISYLIAPGGATYYKITMTVPTPKRRNPLPNTTDFIYRFGPEVDHSFIYPAIDTLDVFPTINLQNRPDILPFYVKDDSNTATNEFTGFRTAYCRAWGPVSSEGDADINCDGITGVATGGVPVSISPKRAY